MFEVKTKAYQGPIELLVSLIEKREIFISDISLVQVTDDYIEHINSLEQKDIENMSDFVLVASTLVLIKSKSLLPTLSLSVEEENTIEDLEARVEEYKRIKKYSKALEELAYRGSSHERGDIKKREVLFAPSSDMNIENIEKSIKSLIQRLPKKEVDLPKVEVEKKVSLKDTIEGVRRRIEQNIQTNFKDFAGGDKADRVHVVIHFLALLELMKQGMVSAYQEEGFGDIIIESETLSTPKYGL